MLHVRHTLASVLLAALVLPPAGVTLEAQVIPDVIKKIRERLKKTAPNKPVPPKPGEANAPTADPLSAEVDLQLLGPQNERVFYSEDGSTVAIATLKGSRSVVLVNGVEGPVFDEVVPRVGRDFSGSLALSPDGRRHAYMARRGSDWIAVVDGKEQGVMATTQTGFDATQIVIAMTEAGKQAVFSFSSDGKRLLYPKFLGYRKFQMVLDGVEGPELSAPTHQHMVVTPQCVGYIGSTEKGVVAVINGKLSPVYKDVRYLVATPDGSHYAFAADTLDGRTIVVHNGQEIAPAVAPGAGASITALALSPTGVPAYVVQVTERRTAGAPPERGRPKPPPLFVGNTELPDYWSLPQGLPSARQTSPTLWSAAGKVLFAPVGTRYAYVKSRDRGPEGHSVVVDGKVGLEYGEILAMAFSPDGSRFMYVARQRPTLAEFIVIDGDERPMDGRIQQFLWSPDGKRYAYEVITQKGRTVIIDGKPSTTYRDIIEQSLTFSADGKRVAFAACRGLSSDCELVIDGVAIPAAVGGFQGRRSAGKKKLTFSPDGSRLAFTGMKGATTTSPRGLFVEGEAPLAIVSAKHGFIMPTFSADSRHFSAAFVHSSTEHGFTVDGKMGQIFQEIVERPETFRFVDANRLSFIAVKDGALHRVTVSLSGG